MENVEIIVDGKKTEIPIKLPKELKEDYVLNDDLDDTLELEEIISVTKELRLNNE